jgi:protein TonB
MAVSMSAPSLDAGISIGGVGFGVSDGEYLPIVKVAPVYPSRALSRGLEGYVIVEFTVTRTGTVRDVLVVESTSTLFERAATTAALKFKYKPRVIDGEPVEVPGVRNKITFEIAR